jgi:hypothetical protein
MVIEKSKGEKEMRQLDISDDKPARQNIKDLKIYGDDVWVLLAKASSDNEGFMKSTKVCNCPDGCVMQVTTQQRNPDGSYSVAEALTYIPGVYISTEGETPRLESMNNGGY